MQFTKHNTAMSKILIIDDDQDICALLSRYLAKKGFKTDTAGTAKTGLEKLGKADFNLVVCDFKLPDADGLDLIKQIKELQPNIQIILITGYSDLRIAVKAMKLGAFDYVAKPLYQDELLLTIKSALKKAESSQVQLKTSKKRENKISFISGISPQDELVDKKINLIAPTDMTTIILGETGTGKEYTARRIHKKSKRNNKPFIALDCGALPGELAGSELFGHVKGAFTGALKDKKGCFEQADGGTLFLDEIGNLSYENQVKLLRVIQERIVQPIGSEKTIPVDVRLLVATNEDLEIAIKKNEFREDLYHRLNEFKIKLYPLRLRQEDIPVYAQHFLETANKSLQKQVDHITDAAMEKLKAYSWPGNLRELRNAIKRFVLLAPADKIDVDLLPLEITEPTLVEHDQEDWNTAPKPLKEVTRQAEKRAILHALNYTNNNKSKAAELLAVDRKTLYNKLDELNISK
jgi:two-component system response regulator HydG